jgi:hypothetical protein
VPFSESLASHAPGSERAPAEFATPAKSTSNKPAGLLDERLWLCWRRYIDFHWPDRGAPCSEATGKAALKEGGLAANARCADEWP